MSGEGTCERLRTCWTQDFADDDALREPSFRARNLSATEKVLPEQAIGPRQAGGGQKQVDMVAYQAVCPDLYASSQRLLGQQVAQALVITLAPCSLALSLRSRLSFRAAVQPPIR